MARSLTTKWNVFIYHEPFTGLTPGNPEIARMDMTGWFCWSLNLIIEYVCKASESFGLWVLKGCFGGREYKRVK